jgi:hypothetical protein
VVVHGPRHVRFDRHLQGSRLTVGIS